MAHLRQAFADRAEAFADVLKMGRTQLQDAVPMTLGQEFSAYAVMLGEDEARLGRGVFADYRNQSGRHRHWHRHQHPTRITPPMSPAAIWRASAAPVSTADNLVVASQDCGSFVQLSGVLKRVAVKLSKTCNDLAPVVIRPARRPWRNQPADHSGRLQHHPWQGQPR